MAVDIGLQTTTYQVGDLTWKLSRTGDEYHQNVTLDPAKFVAGTHYPNGYIPSGTVLGKVTASGLYGPYTTGGADGTETATGILIADCRVIRQNGTTATRVGSGQMVRGDVKQTKLPFQAGAGSIDAPGKVDLPLIRFE
jgi:hypothetical protein